MDDFPVADVCGDPLCSTGGARHGARLGSADSRGKQVFEWVNMENSRVVR